MGSYFYTGATPIVRVGSLSRKTGTIGVVRSAHPVARWWRPSKQTLTPMMRLAMEKGIHRLMRTDVRAQQSAVSSQKSRANPQEYLGIFVGLAVADGSVCLRP